MEKSAADPADPYHRIAELYDLEHDSYTEDIEFLLAFAETISGPILEMGCGSGRVLAALGEQGFEVVGLDTSATMLDRARHRSATLGLEGHIKLIQGDMAVPQSSATGPFGAVVFSLNALAHIASQDRQLEAIRQSRALLAPGGVIIIDLFNPVPDYLQSLSQVPIVEWSHTPDVGPAIDKIASRQVDPIAQTIETLLWYDRSSTDGAVSRTRTTFTLRYVHAAELELMLEVSGFAEIGLYGSYELERLTGSSERLLGIARTDDTDSVNTPDSHHEGNGR